jgi:hypothetical protein
MQWERRIHPNCVRSWRIKGEYAIFRFMAVRSCRVTIQDLEGTAHTVEVTAESLYEAVAQGLAALRRSDWVVGFQQGSVKVRLRTFGLSIR